MAWQVRSSLFKVARLGLILSFILLGFFGFGLQTVHAENLQTITEISTGGIIIHQGDTVFKSDLTELNAFWSASFTWPESVPNGKSLLVVFKGSYGALVGGSSQDGVNTFSQNQALGNGFNYIQKQFFSLGDPSTQAGQYTCLLYTSPSPRD